MEFNKEFKARYTPIDGLFIYDLKVISDSRGWFKENYKQEIFFESTGIDNFHILQNSISFSKKKRTIRGLHAEPYNKFISVAKGKFFGAWVDLRKGSKTYGKSYSEEHDPSKGAFVPRGVANGQQALEDESVYVYLVDGYWSSTAKYSLINPSDPALNIAWPIPLKINGEWNPNVLISDKDKAHPLLKDALPIEDCLKRAGE
jgi:dTDP-4-dehydrorhamnose 3,5-epimerase